MTTRPFPFRATSRGTALAAAAVALLSTASLPAANVEYFSRAGVTAKGFQKFLDDAKDQGYEPAYINGYEVGDHVEYAGVAIKDPDKKPFDSRFDMNDEEFKDYFKEMGKKDFRPTCVSGYHTKEGPRFAAVWVSTKFDKNPVMWHTRHSQGEKEFDDTMKSMRKDGYVATNVTAYQGPDGAVRYTSLFAMPASKNVEWETRHNLTAEHYQDQLDKWHSDGFRVVKVHVYDSPDGLRYLATARQTAYDKKFVWQEHHDMTGAQYQKRFDELGNDGFRPGCICGYRDGGEVKFAVIWSKEK